MISRANPARSQAYTRQMCWFVGAVAVVNMGNSLYDKPTMMSVNQPKPTSTMCKASTNRKQCVNAVRTQTKQETKRFAIVCLKRCQPKRQRADRKEPWQ